MRVLCTMFEDETRLLLKDTMICCRLRSLLSVDFANQLVEHA